MDQIYERFLEILSAALRGESYTPDAETVKLLPKLYRLAEVHHIQPLIVNCVEDVTQIGAIRYARELTITQAQRTADFIVLLKAMEERGLWPVVMKGFVCRALYPEPELRSSVDEDLLIPTKDYKAYQALLAEHGIFPVSGDPLEELYFDRDHDFTLELHTALFPESSDAYGDCNRFFEGAIERAAEVEINGLRVKTLCPTDHLLFLLCHAYKHFLHGGVGIRQICDMALMIERDGASMDWAHIRSACETLHIAVFSAGLFRIAERRLGYAMPAAFAELEVDERDLLEDVLSGGLYGVEDINRAHSSTITLEAVSADRKGKRRKGAFHAIFLPLKSMKGNYPYLRKYPWLLPWAWLQRIWRYLTRKQRTDSVHPTRSIRIANERVGLLKEYGIIE